ncbi:MAG: chromosome segregation ATPase [Cryomorphaceae bacterium]|jgi:chromosome segregation ATPase
MKRITTLLIISFFTLGAAAQENEKQDKSVIKSEIKDLDKLIKDQTKEVEKIEKSLASVRPDLEQAKRDVSMLESRKDSIKSAAQAFDYPSKRSEYKGLKKEYNKAEKSRKKAEKTIAKSGEKISSYNSEVAIAKRLKSDAEINLNKHRVTNSDSLGLDAQKAHASKDKEIEKTASSHGKTVKKQESAVEKYTSIKEEATTELNENSTKSKSLQTDMTDLTLQMDMNDPKVVDKEINDYEKRLSERQSEMENLQLEFGQKIANIAEKHDFIEAKKKEKEEKESVLRRN